MNLIDFRKDIEGYLEIQQEIEVLRKYGFDYKAQKGTVARTINLLHPKKIRLKVSEIRVETPTAKTLRLVPKDHYLPPFQAGQYINMFVEAGGVKTSRPYSIASAPNQTGYYDITVRHVVDGFVSSYLLDQVMVGDSLESTSPTGNFYYNPLFHGKDLVFLAGGSGITPFISMIREVTDRGLDRHIQLIYGSRDLGDVIYREELEERAARHESFTFTRVISEPSSQYTGLTGFITAELIKEQVGDISGKMFYLCGPEAMYKFCLPELDKLGIPAKRIRTELFGLPKDITGEPGWPESVTAETAFKVKIKGRRTITAYSHESLMVALERFGIKVPASCRSGQCSQCRVKLISGKVFQPSGARVRKSDRQFGYIHSCAAYPLTDIEILI